MLPILADSTPFFEHLYTHKNGSGLDEPGLDRQ